MKLRYTPEEFKTYTDAQIKSIQCAINRKKNGSTSEEAYFMEHIEKLKDMFLNSYINMTITIEKHESTFTPDILIKNQDKQIKTLLPHGSGIDSDYQLEENSKNYYLYNSYHVMDEYGYYRTWIDYKLTIPKQDPINFKLTFPQCNSTGYYWINRTMLREYLEQTYAEYIQAVL